MKINTKDKKFKNMVIFVLIAIFYFYTSMDDGIEIFDFITSIGIIYAGYYYAYVRKRPTPKRSDGLNSWPIIPEIQNTKSDCFTPTQEEKIRDIFKEMLIAELVKNQKGDVKSKKKNQMKK